MAKKSSKSGKKGTKKKKKAKKMGLLGPTPRVGGFFPIGGPFTVGTTASALRAWVRPLMPPDGGGVPLPIFYQIHGPTSDSGFVPATYSPANRTYSLNINLGGFVSAGEYHVMIYQAPTEAAIVAGCVYEWQ